MSRIDVVEHAKYIMSVAIRYKKEFPSISLSDIISELNLLVIDMSEKDYDSKYKVTTFIENFPAKKLRQILIYKYTNFTYDNNRNRVFVETCSINKKISDDADAPEYIDSLNMIENSTIENDINEFETIEMIEKSNLSLIEKEIIFRRFGLKKFKVMTLQEIGLEFNLTRERIRVIEKGAKKKLELYFINNNIYNKRKDVENIVEDSENLFDFQDSL
ncbi:MAG: hypothetical protein M0Q13_14800 [Methanothrix sp.]|jgi:hypothetical protein|nr:hypothetical protein [Methanothrix sp.]